MPDKKTCFIIMPISIPTHFLANYDNDTNHFTDVLSELFIPAIVDAGLIPKTPIAKGEDVIHKEIIKNLIETDLVLCDISTLNANVYLELGIRTALNKPVCLIKDEFVEKIPFDVGPVNHHTYNSKLFSKIVKQEIPSLSKHISESLKSSNGENSMWKVFGLKTFANPPIETDDTSFKLDILLNEISSLKASFDNQFDNSYEKTPKSKKSVLKMLVNSLLESSGLTNFTVNTDFTIDGVPVVIVKIPIGQKSKKTIYELEEFAKTANIKLDVKYV